MTLKVFNSGNIWYHENCGYINQTTFQLKNFNENFFYDLLCWLKKSYEVDYENSIFMGMDQTRRITWEDGKTVIITGDGEETEIVAEVNIDCAKDFTYFDNIIQFERFYNSIIEKIKTYKNENQDE